MNSKIFYFLLIIIVSNIITVKPTFALNNQNAQRIFGQNGQNIKATITEKIDQNQQRREERRVNLARKHAERLQNRFSIHYNHLKKMAEKIQNRLNIISSNGKDISSAQTTLEEAKTKIEEAKIVGDQTVNLFQMIQEETWEEQKIDLDQAKEKTVETRRLFVDALKLLKQTVILARSIN
jgi:hypothetical protein